MKFLLFLCFTFWYNSWSSAQVNVGIKINSGFGFIRSSSLKSVVAQELTEPGVIYSNARSGVGTNIGLGGFIQYHLTPKLSLLVEPTLNMLNTSIYLNYKREAIDANGIGTQYRMESNAHLRLLYINIPFVARYVMVPKKKIHAIGGIALNVTTNPRLKIDELIVDTKYAYNTMLSSDVSRSTSQAKINQFGSLQSNLVLGIGKTFRRTLKNLSIDIRYSLPFINNSLSSSEAISGYSSNTSLYGPGSNFSIANSQIKYAKPKNFKLGMIDLCIRYALYKTSKK